ncbi:hypothetical protein JCM10212_006796, partial [Sporobolomyces blumeae]
MPPRIPSRSNDASTTSAAMAAPAWRQFTFFTSTQYPSGSAASSRDVPDVFHHVHSISAIHSNPTLGDGFVLLADLDGNLSWVNDEWRVDKTWKCYEGGRVGSIETSLWDRKRGRVVVVTVGDDASTPFPLLKVWLLAVPTTASTDPSASGPSLTLLRQAPVNPTPNRPSPVSSLAVSPTLSHVVVGLTDGNVVGWKRVEDLLEASIGEFTAIAKAKELVATGGTAKAKDRVPEFVVGGMGKLRIFSQGNKEPITNVGIAAASSTSPTSTPTLFVLTTSEILALPLPPSHGSSRNAKPTATVLDDLGAAVGCAKIMRLGVGRGVGDEGETAERMVVAREEAIYVYGSEGREGCWAYEGPKSAIYALQTPTASSSSSTSSQLPTPYLAIVTPPQRSSLSSRSATIRQHAASPRVGSPVVHGQDELVSKVTIFDPENKFVAFSAAYGDQGVGEGAGIREVVEAWGAVWVLTESGQLHRLTEQPLQNSLSTLYQRNLFTLAVSLAKSRGLSEPDVGEIYRRYGDHLYSKGDFEGSMSCYLKTVGTVQASYVIRKFLDAQRLTHLTSYLQELHSRNLANSDITTLLLNCYTKLADDEALSRFIHSSSRSTSPSRPRPDSREGTDEPPFDLETAIRVLRQASYFPHAIWLAERYKLHGEYLRISIEDSSDFLGALAYVGTLARSDKVEERDEAEKSMKRWGGVLLHAEPTETTNVLVEICCGRERDGRQDGNAGEQDTKVAKTNGVNGSQAKPSRRATGGGGYDVPDSTRQPPSEPSTASLRVGLAEPAEPLPSPRQFFAHFVDHPREFISFLEAVGSRRYGKSLDSLNLPRNLVGGEDPLPSPRPLGAFEYGDAETRDEQAVWNTLFELYVSPLPARAGRDAARGDDLAAEQEQAQMRSKAIKMLRSRDAIPYDETQALLVCTTKGFVDGFVLLYELLGMYEDVVR